MLYSVSESLSVSVFPVHKEGPVPTYTVHAAPPTQDRQTRVRSPCPPAEPDPPLEFRLPLLPT